MRITALKVVARTFRAARVELERLLIEAGCEGRTWEWQITRVDKRGDGMREYRFRQREGVESS